MVHIPNRYLEQVSLSWLGSHTVKVWIPGPPGQWWGSVWPTRPLPSHHSRSSSKVYPLWATEPNVGFYCPLADESWHCRELPARPASPHPPPSPFLDQACPRGLPQTGVLGFEPVVCSSPSLAARTVRIAASRWCSWRLPTGSNRIKSWSHFPNKPGL